MEIGFQLDPLCFKPPVSETLLKYLFQKKNKKKIPKITIGVAFFSLFVAALTRFTKNRQHVDVTETEKGMKSETAIHIFTWGKNVLVIGGGVTVVEYTDIGGSMSE